jgi:hypothetical protein
VSDHLEDVKAEIGARLYEHVRELVTSLIEFDYWGELQDEELSDLLAALEALDTSTRVSLFDAIARRGAEIVRELEDPRPQVEAAGGWPGADPGDRR